MPRCIERLLSHVQLTTRWPWLRRRLYIRSTTRCFKSYFTRIHDEYGPSVCNNLTDIIYAGVPVEMPVSITFPNNVVITFRED